jgi:histone demethylase JARID1
MQTLGTRTNLNYLDQLAKFHKQHGNSLTRFPSVDKRPLDLYKLKKAVETRGGFNRVCKQKKWAEIGRDLGYSGKIMSSLSTSLKNSYQKWLHPYEEYLRVVKPGVQQMLELENGGPYTPSPAPSPIKKSNQGTPAGHIDSPAMRASAALNVSIQNEAAPTPPPLPPIDPPRPSMTPGFTPVNAGGFTAVNAHPPPQPQYQAPPQPVSIPSSFSAANAPNGVNHDNVDSRTSTPLRNGDSPMLSADNTPDLRPLAASLTSLSNGQLFNQLKRTMSQDTEGSMNGETDSASGQHSKRAKKGKPLFSFGVTTGWRVCASSSQLTYKRCNVVIFIRHLAELTRTTTDAIPTVAGSHMTQPRLSTPNPFNPRTRPPDERPGDVSTVSTPAGETLSTCVDFNVAMRNLWPGE